ncbi:phosphatase PAP2 family protein [Mucilaginibacter sp. dw_454]|uniref:phosphatase PAP2 family protein n=1 Tax=Mucilaginibacter sp. dw_454 TaxID=2720079 RepID=UPI001BD34F38|nr:phosphatase PAP2 family protein [Mucilaginibacter sp. dw_454]
MPIRVIQSFIVTLLLLASTSACFAQWIQKTDDDIMIDIQNQRTPEKTGIFLFLSNTYRYGDIGVPAGLLVAGTINNDKGMRENAAFVASSTALSYGVMLLLKHIVKRPRPFIQNINIVPVYRAGSTSFPSGHASTTIATATALSMAYPKWYVIAPAFLWAGSVSYSRMYLGVHYPSDVAAGAAFGVGSALSMSFLKAK